jgi:hypothetical protein
MKLLIIQFSPFTYNFTSFGSKYSPQYSHPQSTSLNNQRKKVVMDVGRESFGGRGYWPTVGAAEIFLNWPQLRPLKILQLLIVLSYIYIYIYIYAVA